MTPYLVHETWVDLEAVQAIDTQPFGGTYPGDGLIRGRATMAFHSGRVEIVVGRYVQVYDHQVGWKGWEEAVAVWDAFIAAWKARRTEAVDPMTGRPESFYKQNILK